MKNITTLHLELWLTKLYVLRDTRLRSNIQINFDEWNSMTMMAIGHLYFTQTILKLQRNRLPCFYFFALYASPFVSGPIFFQ